MKILTSEQMRRVDERTEREFGIPSETLMDNAGRAIAGALASLFPALASMRPLILCGKGNNGGDGLAAARHLMTIGVTSRVILLARRSDLKGPAAAHAAALADAGVTAEEVSGEAPWEAARATLRGHPLIVDAILGTGLRGPVDGWLARVIADLNGQPSSIVSIDIPSGLSGSSGAIAGPAVRADHTLALACPKIAHIVPPAAHLAGQLHTVSIGIPDAAIEAEGAELNLIVADEVAAFIPERDPEGHKGDYGRLLVVGGSAGKSGAAAMTCLAALRSGAGLVTAATTKSAQPILAGHLMEVMTEGLAETAAGGLASAAAPALKGLQERADVLAVGPGLTDAPETAALVRDLVASTALPVVLDADGLNAFAGRADAISGEDHVLILTPHPGEMARLLTPPGTAASVQADRTGTARAFARAHACYLVLKGHNSLVAEPGGQVWVNTTGNPGMATAGSGDVLTGILAALLAQGLSPLESCLLGVHLHGLAGDLAAADRGEIPLMARDLIEFLPDAFGQLDRAGC